MTVRYTSVALWRWRNSGGTWPEPY